MTRSPLREIDSWGQRSGQSWILGLKDGLGHYLFPPIEVEHRLWEDRHLHALGWAATGMVMALVVFAAWMLVR